MNRSQPYKTSDLRTYGHTELTQINKTKLTKNDISL